MNAHLSPASPVVPVDTVLTLAVRTATGEILHQQYLVTESFDYSIILDEIQESGEILSEVVLQRLSEILITREFVRPIDTCLLVLGDAGRASSAIKQSRRYRLNPMTAVVESLAWDIEHSYYDIPGPEGDLHLLHIPQGNVLGHVKILLDHITGVSRIAHLDIVGPEQADFPDRFEDLVRDCLLDQFHTLLTGNDVSLRVLVTRSDLALAQDALHA